MKVTFEQKDRTKILEAIQNAMSGRKLGDLVKFGMDAGKLEVIISKMGTSTLTFKETPTSTGMNYALESEKIAFTHKAFKDDVTRKIVQVIEQAGGKVTV